MATKVDELSLAQLQTMHLLIFGQLTKVTDRVALIAKLAGAAKKTKAEKAPPPAPKPVRGRAQNAIKTTTKKPGSGWAASRERAKNIVTGAIKVQRKAAKVRTDLGFDAQQTALARSLDGHGLGKPAHAGVVDPRLPAPGKFLVRKWGEETIRAKMIENGRAIYKGVVYNSPSKLARAVTGKVWNGYVFFGLTKGK